MIFYVEIYLRCFNRQIGAFVNCYRQFASDFILYKPDKQGGQHCIADLWLSMRSRVYKAVRPSVQYLPAETSLLLFAAERVLSHKF